MAANCEHDHGPGGGETEQLARRSDPNDGPAGMAHRQKQYGQRLRGPLGKINAEIRRGIVSRDVLGYHDESVPYGPAQGTHNREQLADGFDPDSLTPDDFDRDDPAPKQREFMAWLRRQEREGVLSVISTDDNVYVRRALADGDRWAIGQLETAGAAVPDEAASPSSFVLPSEAASVTASVGAPMRASKVRLLFERNFSLLEGITTDMNAQIQDELARGLARGQAPSVVAENISDRVQSVGKHRATLMARHEILYAHNEGAKARYQEAGVERVRWLGHNPCPICAPHVGETFQMGNLPGGGPPLHPQCVGTIAPVID